RPAATSHAPGSRRCASTGDNGAWLAVFLWSQALLLAALATVWLHRVWGTWQTWITAGPVLTALGIAVSGAATRILPNLL
ncbi:hypothetical protein AB0R12_35850, partial [Streptomyces niveus]